MNWKWMMMAGALGAASMGLAGCGDDEDAPCESDEDCASAEVCIGLQGARECEILCKDDSECTKEGEACIQVPDVDPNGATVCDPANLQEACTVDTDCGTGEVCIEGGCVMPDECTVDTDCTVAGETCQSGVCVGASTTTCATTAECIADTAYCADFGATSSCLGVACGDDLNSCDRCKRGPNGGDRTANAPVIFFPEQTGVCVQDTSLCLPGAAPWACKFSFLAFEENGDLPTSGLNNRIRVISSSGSELTVFGTATSQQGNNRSYTLTACFPETTSGNIGTAVLLRDQANNASNTLCVDGRLPL